MKKVLVVVVSPLMSSEINYKTFFQNYTKDISNLLSSVETDLIRDTVKIIEEKNNSGGTIYIAGNGGSSSIASHVSVDFSKVARVQSKTFNNSNIITCFANDYGYENWIKEAMRAYCNANDLLILISSSGKSLNIINAAKFCQEINLDLITLSGFNKDNELSKLGKINFHVNSKNYNYIEMTHHIILVSIVDIFAQKNL